jgi:DNA-binding NarL/FixJ family response regulator
MAASAIWSVDLEPEVVASDTWEELTGGYLRIEREMVTPEGLHLITRVEPAPKARDVLNQVEAGTLSRVLCGEQPKAIAFDLRLAASTVSERCARALARLDLDGRAVPLAVVVAAQCSAGRIPAKAARHERFVEHGATYEVLSVPRPDMTRVSGLGNAERDVARRIIEGLSLGAIAEQRGSSIHTVANQRRRAFSVLRTSGRYGLIRRAAELGCFD